MSEPLNPDEVEKEHEAILIQMKTRVKEPPFYKQQFEPMPAETDQPMPRERSPLESDEEAAITKKSGAVFPMPAARPSAPKPTKEEGSVIVAKELAGQMGTSPEIKGQQRIDERKLAVLKEVEVPAIAHFSYRFVYDGVRYWGHIVEWQLTGSQGVGGLARRHILQALANTSGVQSIEKAKKPNVIARNLWRKDWKQKAVTEGKEVEE